MTSPLSTTLILGYSGLLPFIAVTVAVMAGIDGAFSFFKIYSLSILAFMAGGAWGAIQQLEEDQQAALQQQGLQTAILAYLIALLGVLLPAITGLLLLMLAFILIIRLEQNSLFNGYSRQYQQMRWVLTSVVLLCHLVLLVVLFVK